MSRYKIIGLSIIILLSAGCYYQYSYRLVEPDEIIVPFEKLGDNGEDLLNYLDSKYIYVMGVIDKKGKIYLFNHRRPVIVQKDEKIIATTIDDEQLIIKFSEIRYFYLKRDMPTREDDLK